MAEIHGRKCIISVNSVPIATARTKSFAVNNAPVNVTSDGDDGIQRIMAEPGEKAIETSIEGLYDTAETSMLDLAMHGTNCITGVELDYGAYTIAGDFFLASYSEGQPYNEAITFTSSFQSSGAILKTPSA